MRCKACNAQLLPFEGRWNGKEHDDLCRKCKATSLGLIQTEKDEDLVVPSTIPKKFN